MPDPNDLVSKINFHAAKAMTYAKANDATHAMGYALKALEHLGKLCQEQNDRIGKLEARIASFEGERDAGS